MNLLILCIFAGIVSVNGSRKTIAIFGGGPAGLAATTVLVESNMVDVKLYEKRDRFGGKMVGYVNKRGYAREVSLRVYGEKYFTLGSIFERAGIQPPTTQNGDGLPNFRLLDGESPSITQGTGYAVTDPEIVAQMISLGFSPYEFEYFMFQVAAFEFLPVVAKNSFFHVPFSSALDTFAYNQWKVHKNCTEADTDPSKLYCNEKHTPEFHAYVEQLLGIISAAKPTDSMTSLMYAFAFGWRGLITPINQLPNSTNCSPYYVYFNGRYFASGPTSTRVILKVIRYLNQLTSQKKLLHTQTNLKRFVIENNKIKYAIIRNKGKKEKIYADAYILALPSKAAESIVPGITKGRGDTNRSGFSFQFYLRCLPDLYKRLYFNKTRVTLGLDSPYHLALMIQSPDDGAWEGAKAKFKKGIKYVLSVNVLNVDTPGILYGKSFFNSTRNQALAEILAQIKFPQPVTCQEKQGTYTYNHRTLIRTAKKGLLLRDVKEPYYQKFKKGKYRDSVVGPLKSDGRRWVARANYYAVEPNAVQISPLTQYENLVLAGEYVASPLLPLTTMEHSAETGVLAAQAALNVTNVQFKIPDATKLLDLVDSVTVNDYHKKIQNSQFVGAC